MAARQDEFRLACVVADHFARCLHPAVLWSHLPFGENRSAITGARLKRMGTQRGWPDYLLIYADQVYAVELKAPGGYPSPEQRQFRARFEAEGGHYILARDLETVERELRALGVPFQGTCLARAA